MREVLRSGSWQDAEIAFVRERIQNHRNYVLIDIGANVGLFTLQCLNLCGDLIDRCVCFEPSIDNFACLEFNLNKYSDKIDAYKYALGEVNETISFYKDAANAGNYSLNRTSMKEAAYSIERVEVLAAAPFFREELPADDGGESDLEVGYTGPRPTHCVMRTL